MILFPNCKINLGLRILRRRADGYHDLETLFYPVRGLQDIVEVQRAETLSFSGSGLHVDCPDEKNLCVKAFRLLADRYELPGARIHLHKKIPFGAGLGGGSADAAAVLQGVNDAWELGLTAEELAEAGSRLGSDIPFFLYNRPMLGTGRGEILTPFDLDLRGWHLLLVKPDAGVSTAEAYARITPAEPTESLTPVLNRPAAEWKNTLINDFEAPIFALLPELARLKEQMYDRGAAYAAMSGSGSTLFGLFREEPQTSEYAAPFVHTEKIE